MKTSTLITSLAALALGAALPLGAIAAPPAKTMTEQGVIQNVNAAKREFTLKAGHARHAATFDWNASTQFVENGKPVAASDLRKGERATVNYSRQGKERVATKIAISPGGKTTQAHKAQARKAAGHA